MPLRFFFWSAVFTSVFIFSAYAENFQGRIIDESTTLGIPGARVKLEYTNTSALTDSNGYFNFDATVSLNQLVQYNNNLQIQFDPNGQGFYWSPDQNIQSLTVRNLKGQSQAFFTPNQSYGTLRPGLHLITLKTKDQVFHKAWMNTGISAQLDFKPNNTTSLKKTSANLEFGALLISKTGYRSKREIPTTTQNLEYSLKRDSTSWVFQANSMRTYDFYLSDSALDMLEYNVRYVPTYLNEIGTKARYVPAIMAVNGDTLGTVGLRYKGNYSLHSCFDSDYQRLSETRCLKLSLKVKFDEYNDSLRFKGLKKLKIHAMSEDPSKMRETLSYGLFNSFGVTASRTAYARININGTFSGLYLLVEDVDGRFTHFRFPYYPDGNLYKEVWPGRTSEQYYINGLETNDDIPDVSHYLGFSRTLLDADSSNFVRTVGAWTNLDYWLKYMVVDRAINNWDGVTSFYTDEHGALWGNHNFYIYHPSNDQKFIPIPWDMDKAFSANDPYIYSAAVPDWNVVPASCEEPWSVWSGTSRIYAANCDKFLRLLATTSFDKYVEKGTEFLETKFIADSLELKIENLSTLIAPALENDPQVMLQNWTAGKNQLQWGVANMVTNFRYFLDEGIIYQSTTPP
jgi:hypothetical protein